MITKIIEKFNIALPKDLINKLNLKIGDNIAIEIEDDKIIIKPVLIIPKAQAWLWSKEMQKVESQVEKEVENVPVRKFNINQDVYEDLENW
ncbi:AbrB/MazE/SpoVT family DNA-binding domain-containing protein [Clostridium sp.]|uniref:AbrB/MazE/SpoVT family DNA-binding domain-containing protein n=1 Tax=Clostridium sp. TaxID=1506 RepID=UPI001A5CABD1|nr:AbrB/MazE/SpoVT family DNA-binding domain-containing protein [Clostridium sp.]MBK5235264.1 AbrB/MazE/SpoVT family DNA-binding domain-containing protein [Clostridium sp.]